MNERMIVEILDTYFSSVYNYIYFHLLDQAVTEALVSRIFCKRMTMSLEYGGENEKFFCTGRCGWFDTIT